MSSQAPHEFFQACECAGFPKLDIGAGSRVVALDRPFAVVGSDPRCDLVLDGEAVRRRHCYLQAIGPRVLCVDLGGGPESDDGRTTAPARWIGRPGSARVGGHWLRLAGEGAGGTAGIEVSGRAALGRPDSVGSAPLFSRPLSRVVLEFQTNNVRTRWRMRRAVALVGSAPECTVRLNGSSVSRYHGALVLTGMGLWVVDLLGQVESPVREGVFVNGQRVRFARLDPADTLQIGPFQITVLDSPASAAARPTDRNGVAPDAHGSGEIELTWKERAFVAGQAAGPEAPDVEAVRREFETRLRAQADRHRNEVKTLREEIEELREWVNAHRLLAEPGPAREAGRRGAGLNVPVSVRTLGATRRQGRTSAAPKDRPPFGMPAAALRSGLLSKPGADHAAVGSAHDPAWPGLDGGLFTVVNDTRHLP